MARERILIVEDENITAMDTRKTLQELGYEPIGPVASGKDAIASALTHHPDVILMDIILKGPIDGIETAQAIQSQYRCPVIYVTAHSDQSTLDRVKVTEPFGYVLKPINERELHTAIEMALCRHRLEQQLRESEERYRRVVESSPTAIFVDYRNQLVFVNPAAARLLGAVEPEQLSGRRLLDFVHVESKEMVQGHIDALLQGSQTFLLRNVQLTGLNGTLLDVEITGIAFDYEGEPAVQLAVHDVTEARRMTLQLEHMASHDVLTCLPNRVMMVEKLNKALAHARRYGGHATVIFFDLDHFKIINDSLGHDQGDLFLRTIAERLSGSVREVDTVTRFGGDEFVIVLFDQPNDDDALIRVLERIQQCIRQPVIVGGREYSVTSSMGFAVYPRDGSDAETLLRNADQAMYRAKDQGRNNFQSYSEELHLHVTERLKLHNDLRRALEHDEFIVHFQPQANLHGGNIIGVEALVRWRHPDRGLVSPGQFIDAAEENGLITSIGEFVLRTACKQGKAWQDMGLPPLRIAVNLSSRQFWQADLLEMVERSLRDSGFNPRLLELELTESLILKDVDDAVRTMHALRTIGVELAIDDFGTGYSSLAYLKRFPIGRLKVAQAFLRDIPADPDSATIARAVISLGHSLKLKVIAEGVEIPQQLQFLEAAGCDEIQGYLVSKPLPQREVTELFRLHLQRVNVGGQPVGVINSAFSSSINTNCSKEFGAADMTSN